MWFQSPEFLSRSRKQLLSEQNIAAIIRSLGITKESRIIDIGCGSGELTRRLSEAAGCRCIGVDIESDLIKYAKQYENENLFFTEGNALDLPFPDSSADIVISHTFLTNMFDAETALLEMRRVCSENGKIAAINAETFEYIPNFSEGLSSFPWFADYRRYRLKAGRLFFEKSMEAANGVFPEAIPGFFIENGLENICVVQLGKFFSASDVSSIEDEYRMECSMAELLEKSERDAYLTLLDEKKKVLLSGYRCSDWTGGSNLMVIAGNSKKHIDKTKSSSRYALVENLKIEISRNCGKTEVLLKRSGLCSVASVTIRNDRGVCVTGTGFSPSDAELDACQKFLHAALSCGYEASEKTRSLTPEILSAVSFSDAELSGEEKNYFSFSGNSPVSVNTDCLRWLFPKTRFFISDSFNKAAAEALYDISAEYAFLRILETGNRPAFIDPGRIGDCYVEKYINIIAGHGYHVSLLDISCGSGIPAVALCVFDEKGSVTSFAADYDLSEAVKKSILKIFENRDIRNLTAKGGVKIYKHFDEAAFFSIMNTGENILPESFIVPENESDLCTFVLQKNETETIVSALEKLGLTPYYRRSDVYGTVAVEAILPHRKMMWPFSKKRMSEYFLHGELEKIVSNLPEASSSEVNVLINYIESKKNAAGENTAEFFIGSDFYVPVLHTRLDFGLLLAACYIISGHSDRAAEVLDCKNRRLGCLKKLLSGMSVSVVEKFHSAKDVSDAQEFINDPAGSILPLK